MHIHGIVCFSLLCYVGSLTDIKNVLFLKMIEIYIIVSLFYNFFFFGFILAISSSIY